MALVHQRCLLVGILNPWRTAINKYCAVRKYACTMFPVCGIVNIPQRDHSTYMLALQWVCAYIPSYTYIHTRIHTNIHTNLHTEIARVHTGRQAQACRQTYKHTNRPTPWHTDTHSSYRSDPSEAFTTSLVGLYLP